MDVSLKDQLTLVARELRPVLDNLVKRVPVTEDQVTQFCLALEFVGLLDEVPKLRPAKAVLALQQQRATAGNLREVDAVRVSKSIIGRAFSEEPFWALKIGPPFFRSFFTQPLR